VLGEDGLDIIAIGIGNSVVRGNAGNDHITIAGGNNKVSGDGTVSLDPDDFGDSTPGDDGDDTITAGNPDRGLRTTGFLAINSDFSALRRSLVSAGPTRSGGPELIGCRPGLALGAGQCRYGSLILARLTCQYSTQRPTASIGRFRGWGFK